MPTIQIKAISSEVLEYDDFSSFPVTGAIKKIYIDKEYNTPYRWDAVATAYKVFLFLDWYAVYITGTDTDIEAGAVTVSFWLPFDYKIEDLAVKVNKDSLIGGAPAILDVLKNGVSIFNVDKLKIDIGEFSSLTSADPFVLAATPTEITTADHLTFYWDQTGVDPDFGKEAAFYIKVIPI